MQDGCKRLHGFLHDNAWIIWIILKNHLLEVGLAQNWETMALRTFTTADSFYCIMNKDPHE
jgi:hypothetical protein